jgi:uncharacterized protein YbjT (DUF2867 family)
MTILVTGATGFVGRHVVAQLAEAGERVRAMTRNPTRNPSAARFPDGVEVVGGDLLDPPSVAAALAGADRMYLFPEPRTAAEVVGLAREAGVERIVTLSSGAVGAGLDTDYQLPVEQAVERSGCAWTHLRPGEFASNTLRLWGEWIRTERVVYHHAPDWRGLPTHEADIAAVGVAALLGDGHHGRAYDLTGPERMSARQQVAVIAEALGEEVRLVEVSQEKARDLLLALGGWAADNANFITGFESYSPGHMPEMTAEEWDAAIVPLPTVEEVTGRPPRTFARWAREHVADFR